MLWQVNVGGDTCLFEMDPVAKAVTGRKICGPWEVSQRAVAYDYVTDTYYVGGTNDATVYHVDGAGALIDSQYVGLGSWASRTTRPRSISSSSARSRRPSTSGSWIRTTRTRSWAVSS